MHPASIRPTIVLFHLNCALLVILTWALAHGYEGITGDAQLYAFQALAKLRPTLSNDLYLQNTSQDHFTVFSPLYALVIRKLGVDSASAVLTMFFSGWLTAAAWWLTATLTDKRTAWLCIIFLMMASADYGASGVFHYSEYYLTARLPAQALIVTALAIYLSGRQVLGFFIAAAALAVHPLMALPGILILLGLRCPLRVLLGAALLACLLAVCISLAAIKWPNSSHWFTIMDPTWLNVVQERSQFLFLQLWTIKDWNTNLRPFVLLAFSTAVLGNSAVARLSRAAAVVGVTGLAIALIASCIGPVALLVQGQAWRWVWVAFMLSVLLIPAALLKLFREERCGSLCATLLVAAWLNSNIAGTFCALLGLLSWASRNIMDARALRWSRWAANVIAITTIVWASRQSWLANRSTIDTNADFWLSLPRLESSPSIRLLTGAAMVLLWCLLPRVRTVANVVAFFAIATLAAFFVSNSYHTAQTLVSASNDAHFGEWSRWIPPSSTVLVTPTRDAGGFVWFNLERPNYLALNQSAGVVFSRDTALEVRRRSDTLLPLMTPNWKIRSNLQTSGKQATTARPLTASILVRLCADPSLGFVISPTNVGFRPRANITNGWWKNWNLYDCRQVRS